MNSNEITEILKDFLYLSGRHCMKHAKRLGIDVVLDLTGIYDEIYSAECCMFSKVHKVNIVDSSDFNIRPHFQKCIDIINKARSENKKILVHCVYGVSRAPTIVAAYLMRIMKMSAEDAVRMLQAKRKIVDPNFGFMVSLHDYEMELTKLRLDTLK